MNERVGVVSCIDAGKAHGIVWGNPDFSGDPYDLAHELYEHILQSLFTKGDLYQNASVSERIAEYMNYGYQSVILPDLLKKIPYNHELDDIENRKIFAEYACNDIVFCDKLISEEFLNEIVEEINALLKNKNLEPLPIINGFKYSLGNVIWGVFGDRSLNENDKALCLEIKNLYIDKVINELSEHGYSGVIGRGNTWHERRLLRLRHVGDNIGDNIYEEPPSSKIYPSFEDLYLASRIGHKFAEICVGRDIDFMVGTTPFAAVLDAMIAAVIDITGKPPINLTEFFDKWEEAGFFIDSSGYKPKLDNEGKHPDGHPQYVKHIILYRKTENAKNDKDASSLPEILHPDDIDRLEESHVGYYKKVGETALTIYSKKAIDPINSTFNVRLELDKVRN